MVGSDYNSCNSLEWDRISKYTQQQPSSRFRKTHFRVQYILDVSVVQSVYADLVFNIRRDNIFSCTSQRQLDNFTLLNLLLIGQFRLLCCFRFGQEE